MTEENVRHEEVKVTGEALVGAVRTLLHEGNVRQITIKNEEGKTLLRFPLTIGVVSLLLIPWWTALAALAALAVKLTIVMEKVAEAPAEAPAAPPVAPVPSEPPAPPEPPPPAG